MKKRIPAAILVTVLIPGCVVTGWSSVPGPLTQLRSVHELTNDQASEGLAVAFEATVTYDRDYDRVTFVQDGDSAIFVLAPAHTKLAAGDRVLVRGTTRASFRPFIEASDIAFLRHGILPPPVAATFDELIRADFDCRMVTVRGVVRSADLEMRTGASLRSLNLQILTDGGYIQAFVDSENEGALKDLLDAEVEVTGVSAGIFDDKKQLTGAMLHVSAFGGVKILKPARLGPHSLAITPMDEIISGYHVRDLTRRIRVRGTITYHQAGAAVVLQSGEKSLWIVTRSVAPMRVGDVAEAIGFPDVHDGSLMLSRGQIEDTHVQAPIAPHRVSWEQMTSRGFNVRGHAFDLVSIEGTVTTQERDASQDEYVLFSDGHLFSAIYRHPEETGQKNLAPMKTIPPGSRVRLTGICIVENLNPSDNLGHDPFNILLSSADDILIVSRPPWLSVQNLSYIASALLLIVAAAIGWGWSLRRKVKQQTATLSARIEAEAALERRMAQIEQRRSCILEDINGSESLVHILSEIAELVTFLLNGAPCWCELRDELCVGRHPTQMDEFRTAQVEIAAGSGPVLGSLVAGFSPQTLPSTQETEALSTGARLATLAIENRRLYDDLLHRSEHDLLTGIANRFSLEHQIDKLMLMRNANRGEPDFGLIYIDLDRFKQVNDRYGHRIGDLYLQEVARRMKLQMRQGDMLARIGGDEFIALAPVLRSRADAEDIASRLERCFDAPFELEGLGLHGSASIGIAVYPEDGVNKEELQRFADAAMYEHKQAKRTGLEPAGERIAS